MTISDKISEIEIHLSYIEQCNDRIEKRKLQKPQSLKEAGQAMAANIHDSVMISMAEAQIRIIQSQQNSPHEK